MRAFEIPLPAHHYVVLEHQPGPFTEAMNDEAKDDRVDPRSPRILMDFIYLQLIAGILMCGVGIGFIAWWRMKTQVRYRWFLIGGALWVIAVAGKVPFQYAVAPSVYPLLAETFPRALELFFAGLYVGLISSLFEIGLTLLAVLIWKSWGANPRRGIGIALGAGAIEALILGLGVVLGVTVYLAGVPDTEVVREALEGPYEQTPLFWLLPPTERFLTVPVHTAARALVLLGVVTRRKSLVAGGFLLFMGLDGLVGGAHVAGLVEQVSTWWILVIPLVFAVASAFILKSLFGSWPDSEGAPVSGSQFRT